MQYIFFKKSMIRKYALILSVCFMLAGFEGYLFSDKASINRYQGIFDPTAFHTEHHLSPLSIFQKSKEDARPYYRQAIATFQKVVKYSVIVVVSLATGLSLSVAHFFVDISYDADGESQAVESLLPSVLQGTSVENHRDIELFLTWVFHQNEQMFREYLPELSRLAVSDVKVEKIMGLYFYLVETGKIRTASFPMSQVTPLMLMKANVYKSYFVQKGNNYTVPVNDMLLSELAKDSGGVHYEMFMEWEGNLYSHRLISEERFLSHLKETTGLTKEAFMAAFDEYFFPVLNYKLKAMSITLTEREIQNIRDFSLIMTVYQFVHRFAEDEIDTYTNIPGRTTVGFHARSASLGAFQGYEGVMSDVFSNSPEIRALLQQETDEKIRSIARRWENFSSMEIQDDIKSKNFLFGIHSPVNDFWQFSLLGVFPYKIDNYLEVYQKLKKIGISNPALNAVISLETDKNRIPSIRKYFYKEFYNKDLSQLRTGEAIRLSPEYMQFVHATSTQLKNWGGYLEDASDGEFFQWFFTYEDIFGSSLPVIFTDPPSDFPRLKQKSA